MPKRPPTAPFRHNNTEFCIVELRDAKDSPVRGVGIARCTIAAAHWNAAAQEHIYSLHLHVSRANGTDAKVYVEEVPGALLSHSIPEEADAKSRLVLAQMSSTPVPWVHTLFQIEAAYLSSNTVEEFEVATAARRTRHTVGPPVLPLQLLVDKVLADLGVLDLIAPFLDTKDLVRLQAVSRSLRRAGIASEVVNREIRAIISNMDHMKSLKLWVVPRGALVQHFSLKFETRENKHLFKKPLSEMVQHFKILHSFSVKMKWGCAWSPPPALWKLPLQNLTLIPTVAIPERAFGCMQQLTQLDIRAEGALPEGFVQLRQLKDLSLYIFGKQFVFPAEISQLSALESLKMQSENYQLKSLSPHIGLLTTLQRFKLFGGQIKGLPVEFFQLTALRTLQLEYPGTIGPLPSTFGDLTALEKLELSHCEGVTSLPSEISRLQKLHTLCIDDGEPHYVRKGGFHTLPPEIGSLRSSLRTLMLINCTELQSLPREIGRCTRLEELILEWTKVTTLPHELFNLRALSSLSLSRCELLEEMPPLIGHLTALRSLNLYYCEKLESIPKEIGQLKALTYLNLSFCTLLPSLPQSLSRLSNLEVLDIQCSTGIKSLRPDILRPLKLKIYDYYNGTWVFGSGSATPGLEPIRLYNSRRAERA